MLAQERYDVIMEQLETNRIVKVVELCSRFGVSIETVRRDLEHLENLGKLKRVYGGAILEKLSSAEPAYTLRSVVNEGEKKRIGRKTAELIQDGETLIIDLGTTTLEVARHLKEKHNLTIITNCLKIAEELVDVPGFRVILSGGQLRPGELALSGFATENFMQGFNVDKTIVGVGGITVQEGITDYHIEETQVRRLMIERGQEVIAVADYSKFGVKALVNVCPLEKIDVLVTDAKVSQKTLEEYRDRHLEVLIAT